MDDPIFKGINLAQWLWYHYSIIKDEDEAYVMGRNIAEHGAWFSNPNVVQQIREEREKQNAAKEDQMKKTVKALFGKDLNIEEAGKVKSTVDLSDMGGLLDLVDNISSATKELEQEKVPLNYKKWLEMDLDNG